MMDLITGDEALTRKFAMRYAWLRYHPSFETEAFLGGLSPEEYDAAVDKAIGESMPFAAKDEGK